VRVATWNINGVRARLPFVLRWLAERRPDVVAVQETKVPDADFPHEAFAEAGYRTRAHGQKGFNGVALLVRQDLGVSEARVGLPGQEDLGARLILARVQGAGGQELDIASVYVPNGKHTAHPDFGRKLAWLDALLEHLEGAVEGGRPLLVGGDFNVVPGPLDSWNEEELRGTIFHTGEERERFSGLLDLGLRDLFREAHPDLQAFSWWDYRGGAFHRKQGLRIDFLLATPELADRLRAVEIDREYRKKQDGLTASDHAPVLADLGEG